MKRVDTRQLPSYLDEFMWRERYGQDPTTLLDNMCPSKRKPTLKVKSYHWDN